MAAPTSPEEARRVLVLVLDENLVISSSVWNKIEPTASAYMTNSYTAQTLYKIQSYSLNPRLTKDRLFRIFGNYACKVPF